MIEQIPIDSAAVAAAVRSDDTTHQLTNDLAYKRLAIVNVAFFGRPGASDREWVLVDAGVIGTTALIKSAVEKRFGKNSRPAAIIMTHGHFDHVGGLKELSELWDAPIYAHPLEHPYLDGRSSYAPMDPTVGGGLMSLLLPLFPSGPIDVRPRLRFLPDDGTVPGMPDWQWIHTPGHAPGHVSLWRESDQSLIVGDAFITTNLESAYALTLQKPEIHGPPTPATPDWVAARASVEKLAALEPALVTTGHGQAMRGPEMTAALRHLAVNFDAIAIPEKGRYVNQPAQADGSGTTYIPEKS
jgi:glyoxylase-like metal-dependent hydrolase (beta-lactamase superfamily II)